MQAFQVTNAAQQVAPAGNRRFVHITNVFDTTIYVQYDGDSAALTTANGLPIAAGQTLMLNNDGLKQLFIQAINVIHGAGAVNKEIRLQGV